MVKIKNSVTYLSVSFFCNLVFGIIKTFLIILHFCDKKKVSSTLKILKNNVHNNSINYLSNYEKRACSTSKSLNSFLHSDENFFYFGQA